MTANAFAHPPVYSPWFDRALQDPWEAGVYEVETSTGQRRFSFWDGIFWACTADTANGAHEMRGQITFSTITRWRGIVPPSRLPRFVSESWADACARVPALAEFSDKSVNEANVPGVLYAVDCMPGYELWQFAGGIPDVSFIYRRRDPA